MLCLISIREHVRALKDIAIKEIGSSNKGLSARLIRVTGGASTVLAPQAPSYPSIQSRQPISRSFNKSLSPHVLLLVAVIHAHGHRDRSDGIIDSLHSSEPPVSTPPRPGTGSSARSTPTSSNRRRNITSQLYHFALGFPQTPPEISPELDPVAPQLEDSQRTTPGEATMGSFLFKW